jgi:hypothetical protein
MNGYVYDFDAMVEKIKLSVAKPELRREKGSSSFDRVNEHFNDIKVTDFLRNFYAPRTSRDC